MEHLTREQTLRLRQRLEEELAALGRRDEAQRAAAREARAPDVGDRQDAAAIEAAQVTQLSLSDYERGRARELEAAMRRMDAGTFGICEDTGEEIPFARLWAEPTARLTVEAQELREREASEAVELREAY